jgi:lactate dehydrogenase-like 2-hydroxyacid dehydrogenase
MDKKKVILAAALYPETYKTFKDLYETLSLRDIALDDLPASWKADCEVLVTNSLVGVSPNILEQLPGIQLVANFGTGVDKIDLDYCKEKGIAVTHTPGVLTEDVADLAIGLILSTLRQISTADRYIRKGLWGTEPFALTRSFRGMKVGFVGLGQIGKEIARLSKAFETKIGYYGPNKKDVNYRYFNTPEELSAWADILVAACPGGSATNGIISKEVLEKLGPESIFINIARGSVVDEKALVKALVNGNIAGAGLDVFADEPHVPEELLQLDNVVLQPHLGSATHRTRREMGKLCLANVEAYFSREKLLSPYQL